MLKFTCTQNVQTTQKKFQGVKNKFPYFYVFLFFGFLLAKKNPFIILKMTNAFGYSSL